MRNKLQIEYRNPSDLNCYKNNSRKHSNEQIERIKKSINEFGFLNPVLLDENDVVVAGHARKQAALELGLEEIPTIRTTHLTEEQMRAYVIADNRLAELSEWDDEILKIELDWLDNNDFDITLTGFDDLIDIESITEEEDEGELDIKENAEPVSKPGDIWLLGKHRVMCGDSTSFDDIDTLCDGGKVDLWITDPPYNVAYEGKTEDALKIENDDMDDAQFRQFLTDAYSAADSALKAGASFYIWHADSEGYNFRGAAKDVGWQVRQCLIWVKNTLVMGRQDYHWKHEPCLYGWKDGASHNWYSDRKQTTVLEFDKPTRNGEHPTMKPVPLFEYQIINSTARGDVVLDSFGGSGTTLIACENLGRIARLMELDPKYADVIVERWQKHTGKEAVLESTGETFNSLRGKEGNE